MKLENKINNKIYRIFKDIITDPDIKITKWLFEPLPFGLRISFDIDTNVRVRVIYSSRDDTTDVSIIKNPANAGPYLVCGSYKGRDAYDEIQQIISKRLEER